MKEEIRKQLVERAAFEERLDDNEHGTITLYFIVPKDALDVEFLTRYPEAEMACISLEFNHTSIPNPCDITTEISPTSREKDGSLLDYDWTDIEFQHSEIETLLNKELCARPYLLISVLEGEIMTERFRYLEEARNCMVHEMLDASRLTTEDIKGEEYENEEQECGYSYSENCAYVRDGVNHDNYDWRIIKLF